MTDHAGTPMRLVNENGRVIWQAEPDDWGAVRNEKTFFQGDIRQPIRFQGQWLDEESGFYYNRHRFYDPRQGRYITQDPIGLEGGLNFYSYVDGDSVSYVDPEGLSGVMVAPRPWIGSIGSGVGSGTRPFPGRIDPALPIPDVGFPRPPRKDPNGEYCRSLEKKINHSKDEIYNKRIPDLENNTEKKNLPWRIGPGELLKETVRGHEKILNRRLCELRNM